MLIWDTSLSQTVSAVNTRSPLEDWEGGSAKISQLIVGGAPQLAGLTWDGDAVRGKAGCSAG